MNLGKKTTIRILNEGYPIKPPCLTDYVFLKKISNLFFNTDNIFQSFILDSYFSYSLFSLCIHFSSASAFLQVLNPMKPILFHPEEKYEKEKGRDYTTAKKLPSAAKTFGFNINN
jgi:hypothetical protein